MSKFLKNQEVANAINDLSSIDRSLSILDILTMLGILKDTSRTEEEIMKDFHSSKGLEVIRIANRPNKYAGVF